MFEEWVSAHLSYPEKAAVNHIQGKVVLSFIISEIGDVKNVKVIEGLNGEFNAEAVRVVKQGKPIATELLVPFSFKSDSTAEAIELNVHADATIESGGKVYTIAQLNEIIPPHKDGNPLTIVRIIAADDVLMGAIADVKTELRKIGSLKVQYYSSATGQEGVTRHMPPFPKADKAKKSDVPEVIMPKMKRENVFIVRINSADKIFLENAGKTPVSP